MPKDFKDVSGVRIVPPSLEFKECIVGKNDHLLTITVLNISKISKSIRIYAPKEQNLFELDVENPQLPVAPGLDVKAIVSYRPQEERIDADRLVITVDGDVIEIPIFGFPSLPNLGVDTKVDFGSVVNNGKIVVQHLRLRNDGSKEGEFSVNYDGDKPITFLPNRGFIQPFTEIKIRVEYVAKHPVFLNEKASIYLELKEPIDLHIKGKVVEGKVELLKINENYSNTDIIDHHHHHHQQQHHHENLDSIKFGDTYYGTDCTQAATLYNNSPESIAFVVVLDEDSVGQESGKDLVASAGNTRLKAELGGEMNDLTSLVTTFPNWGTLKPYEKLPIFFRFSPRWNIAKQGFIATKKPPPRQDFSLFMKIQAIGASEGFKDQQQQQQNGQGEGDDNLQKQQQQQHQQCKEIAVTGTALPVELEIFPKKDFFDFDKIYAGEIREILAKVVNKSKNLAVNFQFRRQAHFLITPESGTIKAGDKLETVYKFEPKQIGNFQVVQYLDVMGTVAADRKNAFRMTYNVIESVPIYFRGECLSTKTQTMAKFNMGITPLITNEVGINCDTGDAATPPSMAVLNTAAASSITNATTAFPNDRSASVRPSKRNKTYQTIFTKEKRYNFVDPDYSYTEDERSKIDEHKNRYKTIIDNRRHDRFNKQMTKDYMLYNNPIDNHLEPAIGLKPKSLRLTDVKPDPRPVTPPNQRWKLLSSKELAKLQTVSAANFVDGLNALPITMEEKKECQLILTPAQLHKIIIGPPEVNYGNLALKSQSQYDVHIINNLNQFIWIQFKIDCRQLQQSSPLSQVVPARSKARLPLILECVTEGKFQRSIEYSINRSYQSHITVFANVVPLSLRLSGKHLIVTPNVGLPPEAGYRSVVTLTNDLNETAEFTWNPIIFSKKRNSGGGGGGGGIAFSIRPAAGCVDAKKSLDCEVVFHPSFMAPIDAEFQLIIKDGLTETFTCRAKLPSPHVQFVERRLQFGALPINLSTTKKALLQNFGQTHAYFQVCKPNALPGITVRPHYGCVPIGGYAELDINVCSAIATKFDDKIEVAIRAGKTIDVRIGGYIESPQIDIDLERFQFGGVYCGSKFTKEFTLINRGKSKTNLEFDFRKYLDFSVIFPDHMTTDDVRFMAVNRGRYSITLEAGQDAKGLLIFEPTEVAAYDFLMTILANDCKTATPPSTPLPEEPKKQLKSKQEQQQQQLAKRTTTFNRKSSSSAIHKEQFLNEIVTPKRKVTATALRKPLILSKNKIEFIVTPTFNELSNSTGIWKNSGTVFKNETKREIKWCVDTSKANKTLEKGIFKFLYETGMPYMSATGQGGGIEGILKPEETHALGVVFCPDKPGYFEVEVPLILDDDFKKPYAWLKLIGILKAPKIWFDPTAIILIPVPLQMMVTFEFEMIAGYYKKRSKIDYILPEVTCDDGTICKPLKIQLLNNNKDKDDNVIFIESCSGEDGQPESFSIKMRLFFQNDKPISFCQPIIFKDYLNNTYELPVTATSDNSILTNYPFLAQHRQDHQIVCMKGMRLCGQTVKHKNIDEGSILGEAILVPIEDGDQHHHHQQQQQQQMEDGRMSTNRASTTATSNSNFQLSGSSYDTIDSETSQTESSLESIRDGALNKASSSKQGQTRSVCDEIDKQAQQRQSRSLGSAIFPDENTDEGYFHLEILNACQRWFSSQAWPNGCYPISIPTTLREALSRRPRDPLPLHMAGKDKDGGGGGGNKSMTTAAAIKQLGSTTKKEMLTIYDMISYLAGRPIPGIAINSSLPDDPIERAKQVHWQHSTLLTFARQQGAKIGAIKPEYLMTCADYKVWEALQQRVEMILRQAEGEWPLQPPGKDCKTSMEEIMNEELFEAVSKRAWTDLLLQLYKVLVLSKITLKSFKKQSLPPTIDERLPVIDLNSTVTSNVYSINERILLIWLNFHYEQQRKQIWGEKAPAARWIVNFDLDLLDGLVLGAVIGSFAPWTIDEYMKAMYTRPETAEQCLHNALRISKALWSIGIDYDFNAIDITDPNPIGMMMLVTHLYSVLPSFLSKNTIEMVAILGKPVLKIVKVTNPSNKSINYTAILSGKNANNFQLPKGNHISIGPKATAAVNVQLTASHLKPVTAVLILASRRTTSIAGVNLVFNLSSQIIAAPPKSTFKITTPCYEIVKVPIPVRNIFNETARFKIFLVQHDDHVTSGGINKEEMDKLKVDEIISIINNNNNENDYNKNNKKRVGFMAAAPFINNDDDDDDKKEDNEITNNKNLKKINKKKNMAFNCALKEIDLKEILIINDLQQQQQQQQSPIINVEFLPIKPGKYTCSIVISNLEIGDFLYEISAIAENPNFIQLEEDDNSEKKRNSTTGEISHEKRLSIKAEHFDKLNNVNGGYDDDVNDDDDDKKRSKAAATSTDTSTTTTTLTWQCLVGSQLKRDIILPVINQARQRALQLRQQQLMTEKELARRKAAGTLNNKFQLIGGDDGGTTERIEFKCELLNNNKEFSIASKIVLLKPDQHQPARKEKDCIYTNILPNGYFKIPVKFKSSLAGQYKCIVKLTAANSRVSRRASIISDVYAANGGGGGNNNNAGDNDDIRLINLQCTAVNNKIDTIIEFNGPVGENILQKIPIHNTTSNDWNLQVYIRSGSGSGGGGITNTTTAECCWSGPSQLIVPCNSLVNYPLNFKPNFEGLIEGRILFEGDQVELKFNLLGKSEKSLPLDIIRITCQCNEILTQFIDVPNKTKSGKLNFTVHSDLYGSFATTDKLQVLPGQTERYELKLHPLKRGHFKGILSFLAKEEGEELEDGGINVDHQDKSLYYRIWYVIEMDVLPGAFEEEITIRTECQKKSLVEIQISNPLETEELNLQAIIIDDDGGGPLSGPKSIRLSPASKVKYELLYFPTKIGLSSGQLIFQSSVIGEFWYKFNLIADPMGVERLPILECELGSFIQFPITLANPTQETLMLQPHLTNTINYRLSDNGSGGGGGHLPIRIAPRTTIELNMVFMPSKLGSEQHECKIIFKCPQLGEWIFIASGIGLLPKPKEPISITSQLAHNSTVIVPFRNSLDVDVIVDVVLKDKNVCSVQGIQNQCDDNNNHDDDDDNDNKKKSKKKAATTSSSPPPLLSPFKVLLKENNGLRLSPRETLDIPITYVPEIMISSQATLMVNVRRQDGNSWTFNTTEIGADKEATYAEHLQRTPSGSLKQLQWIYPIHGFPEAAMSTTTTTTRPAATLIQCQARCCCEERLELILAGVVPGSDGPIAKFGRLTPIQQQQQQQQQQEKEELKSISSASVASSGHGRHNRRQKSAGGGASSASLSSIVNDDCGGGGGVIVTKSLSVTEEFSHSIEYISSSDDNNNKNDEADNNLDSLVNFQLVRKERLANGLVKLFYNVFYQPTRPMCYMAKLVIRAATGGIWKFPLKFLATDPQPDDYIDIESIGLNKFSFVEFEMNSKCEYAVPFHAYFLGGGGGGNDYDDDDDDSIFQVKPTAGQLPPATESGGGILIQVGFKPEKYGKNYTTRLVIQTSTTQWTYAVRGIIPNYFPPEGKVSKSTATRRYRFKTSGGCGGGGQLQQQRRRRINLLKKNMLLNVTAVSSPIKGGKFFDNLKAN